MLVTNMAMLSDGSFVCEALSEEDKYRWMLMIHFAKSRLENGLHISNGDLGGCLENGVKDSDFLIHATNIISQRSNKAIDQFFENRERENLRQNGTESLKQ